MKFKISAVWWTLCLLMWLAPTHAQGDEEASAIAATGRNPELEEQERAQPSKLPDFTKGEPMPPPGKGGWPTWQFGPTGIIGMKNAGGDKGDQIRVINVAEGSPAAGKVISGDVIIGVHGKRFELGGSMNRIAGDAIIQAETEARGGNLTVHLWRDRNWLSRTGTKDPFGVDLDKMLKEAEAGSADIYDWQEEEEKTAAVEQMAYDKYPVDGFYTNINLKLEVMGTYSDDSPWNCPVVKKARDNALKIIAERLKPDVRGLSKRGGGWPDVLALVASGEPEYVDIAKAWVHRLPSDGRNGICHDMNHKGSVYDVTYGGMQSWHHGFGYLEMAIYYDATHDDFILPEIRKRAICAALGQNGGGSWGHTFAFPSFNGGMLHRNNPGYGAMNNAGTRCFFLLTLAKKAGIDHPEIDAAIARSRKFFGTYIDRGCIPYGYHTPYPSDDSNGKNYGAAYAFYTLGDKYAAKYFSMGSAHASFTRRGGHGSPTLWYYTPLSAHIAGPEVVKAYMRNMRYFYTLSRRHDGSFVFLGEQSPGIGGKGMRNATATVALHLSRPLGKLIITGKDADPKFYATEKDLDELLMSARSQIKDPVLLEKIGKPYGERSTDDLFKYVNHWHPSRRRDLAAELGKRYQAGEKDVVSRLLPLLSHEDARMREGACWALGDCGKEAVLPNMSKVVAMLKDDAEFVRMRAARVIGDATDPGDKTREIEVMKCLADDHPQITGDQGNVKWAAKGVLLPGKRRGQEDGPTTLLTTSPFKAGYDEDLVRRALERIVTADPQGTVPRGWDKHTLLKLAGPVTFSAEELQVNDAMFGGARKQQAQALLRKHGYHEAIEGNASNLRKRRLLERSLRVGTTFKDSYITPKVVKQEPGLFKPYLDALNLWQLDNPTHTFSEKTGKGRPPITTAMNLLIAIIERADEVKWPSVWPEVQKMFLEEELPAAGGDAEKMALCRKELDDVDRKNFFRKMAAMSYLAEKLGPNALDDISPFLGHEQWRLKRHANELVVSLVNQGGGERLLEIYDAAQSKVSGIYGNWNAEGILDALADAGYKAAIPAIKASLKHHDPRVRGAAVKAVFKIGGDPELKTVFAFLRTVAEEREDFFGVEKALLSKKDDPKHVDSASKACRALLSQSSPEIRRSVAWVLGQFGGEQNRAAIEKAAASSEDPKDIMEMVRALAYCPDREANENMLGIIKLAGSHRDAVTKLGVHRMVGRNGMGDVSDKDRVSFGREILNLKYDPALISFFGRVHTAPSMQLLYDVMKKGGDQRFYKYGTSTEVAAKAIVECAEGIANPSKEDSALATEVLADLVEFIEVTHLRGGAKVHVKSHRDAMPYMMWQDFQARAGRALLKFHKPKERKIPTFDDVDLDI